MTTNLVIASLFFFYFFKKYFYNFGSMWEFLVAFQLGLFSSDLKIHKFVTILLDKKDFIVYQHFFLNLTLR